MNPQTRLILALSATILVGQPCLSASSEPDATSTPPALEKLIKAAAARDTRSRYQDAIAILTNAIEEFPDRPRAYYWRGLAYLHNGRPADAIADLSQAIKLDSHYKDACVIRSIALIETKEFDKALADLDTVIGLDPQFKEAFQMKSEIYRTIDKKEQAEQAKVASSQLPSRSLLAEGEPSKPDLDRYMSVLQPTIKGSGRPPQDLKSKRIVSVFKIHRDGSVSDIKLTEPSKNDRADAAALAAIRKARIKPLPPGSPADIDVQFTFDYNVSSPAAGGFRSGLPFPSKQDPVPSALLAKAKYAETKQDYDRAVQLYKKALAHASLDRRPSIQHDLAEVFFLISGNPDHTPAENLKHLHQALYYQFDHAPAQNALKTAIESRGMKPDSFDDRVRLGDEARDGGDHLGAVVEYLEALKIKDDPNLRKKLDHISSSHSGTSESNPDD